MFGVRDFPAGDPEDYRDVQSGERERAGDSEGAGHSSGAPFNDCGTVFICSDGENFVIAGAASINRGVQGGTGATCCAIGAASNHIVVRRGASGGAGHAFLATNSVIRGNRWPGTCTIAGPKIEKAAMRRPSPALI